MSDKKDDATIELVLEVIVAEEHHPDCALHENGRSSSGPAKYNSRAYVDNFSNIFGNKNVGQA
jgi:hypothetical protein